MFGCLGGVRRANSRRKLVFFWKECTFPFCWVVVVSFYFSWKRGKEVRLSHVFLAGSREDVRVDVHIERRVEKLALPPFFWWLVGNCQTDVLLVWLFFVAGKMGRRGGYRMCFWQELGKS